MNYSEPLSFQVFVFFKALASGVLIGVLYDLLEVIFKTISGIRKSIIIKDLLFCFFASLFSFFFMVLYNNGIVRFNLVLAQAIGAIVFHICLGKYIFTPLLNFFLFIKKSIIALVTPFLKLFERICNKITRLAEAMSERIKKAFKNKKLKAKSKFVKHNFFHKKKREQNTE